MSDRWWAERKVRFSYLKNIAKSPAHYLAGLKGGRQTGPMRLGSLVDCILFGGKQPVVYAGRRQGKAWDQFREENQDKDIVSLDEYATANAMVEAIRADPHASRVLEGERRCEINWRYLGRDCQSHPDVLNPSCWVTDLKTCATAQPDRFRGSALRYGYHVQLASYQLACEAAGIPVPPEAYLVTVESAEPYPVVVHQLTERALEQGRKIWRTWFEQLLMCEAAGHFPGYSQSVVAFDTDDELELTFGDEAEAA